MDFILKEARGGPSLKNTPQGKCIVGFGVQVSTKKIMQLGLQERNYHCFQKIASKGLFLHFSSYDVWKENTTGGEDIRIYIYM